MFSTSLFSVSLIKIGYFSQEARSVLERQNWNLVYYSCVFGQGCFLFTLFIIVILKCMKDSGSKLGHRLFGDLL